MAFFYFLLGEKLKNWKKILSFQIYVPYDLKNQVCNIYKYRTYNRNFKSNFAGIRVDKLSAHFYKKFFKN